ncbi:MAG: polymer-forming cytoskeletal protein [Rhodospirillaceae bacterium]|nr:polymer-forming cytoskeletal protein [Rhodospirillaceae bacterium]
MFSKANNKATQIAQDVRPDLNKAVPSIISAGLSIEGHLASAGEVQVDGTVNGDIRCKSLIVGVKGSVFGEVIAQTVRMHGSIKGMIRAKSVFLASTARMSGDVEHESLAIEPGAYMEGHCKRISEANLTPIMEDRRPPRPEAVPTSGLSGPRLAPAPKPAIVAA